MSNTVKTQQQNLPWIPCVIGKREATEQTKRTPKGKDQTFYIRFVGTEVLFVVVFLLFVSVEHGRFVQVTCVQAFGHVASFGF